MQTAGLPAEAVAIIESFQTYHKTPGPPLNQDPLLRLSSINNIDKHRHLAVHPIVLIYEAGIRLVSETGDESHRMLLSEVSSEIKTPNINFDVTFGSAAEGLALTMYDILEVHQFVSRNVLPRLARFDP